MPAARVGPVARALYLGGNFPLLPVTLIDHRRTAPSRRPGVTVEYGEYLATIGGCRAATGSALAGDANPDAPDITVGRIGSWTEQDFFRSLRQGIRPDGSVIDPEKMPWVRSGQMTDEEIRAVWMYIRSLPAGKKKAEGRSGACHPERSEGLPFHPVRPTARPPSPTTTRAMSLPAVLVAPRITTPPSDHHQRQQQDRAVQAELIRQHPHQRQRDRVAGQVDEEQVRPRHRRADPRAAPRRRSRR